MINFDAEFSKSLLKHITSIKDANDFFNSTNIDVILFHTELQRFNTFQHLANNPVSIAHTTIEISQGELTGLPFDLFTCVSGDFFTDFHYAVGTKFYNMLIVAPQLGATISVDPNELQDLIFAALSLKYMAQYASCLLSICQSSTPVPYKKVDELQQHKEMLETVVLPDFNIISYAKDFLDIAIA